MNPTESRFITRLDFTLSRKQGRRARVEAERAKARAEVARALEQARSQEDADIVLKARVGAYAFALNHTSGPASLVAFLGQIAGRFGAEVKPKQKQSDEARRVFQGGGE